MTIEEARQILRERIDALLDNQEELVKVGGVGVNHGVGGDPFDVESLSEDEIWRLLRETQVDC